MTWGLKIVLAGMACKDWILLNFNLDLQLLSVCYHNYVDMHSQYNFNTIMHACLDLFVACSSVFVLPWLLLRVLGLPS